MRKPPEEVAIRMVLNMRGSEIGGVRMQHCCSLTITMPIATVAYGTVLLEHVLALHYHLGCRGKRVGEIGGRIGVHEHNPENEIATADQQAEPEWCGPPGHPAATAGQSVTTAKAPNSRPRRQESRASREARKAANSRRRV